MSSGNVRKISGGRITIPPALMAQAGLRNGSLVEIVVKGGHVILREFGYEEPEKKGAGRSVNL